MTSSTSRHEVQARAARLAQRLGSDLAELAVVAELADHHGLVLPDSLERVVTALDLPAIPAEAERAYRLLNDGGRLATNHRDRRAEGGGAA